ncbi:MAG: hypothetical protein M3P53_02090 [Actinomycetota bacterium]|nr:hypothetical protein [Actinomycetota bacterium]
MGADRSRELAHVHDAVVAHIDDLDHRDGVVVAGDDERVRLDRRRVGGPVEKRPRQAGVVLRVPVDVDLDRVAHRLGYGAM